MKRRRIVSGLVEHSRSHGLSRIVGRVVFCQHLAAGLPGFQQRALVVIAWRKRVRHDLVAEQGPVFAGVE